MSGSSSDGSHQGADNASGFDGSSYATTAIPSQDEAQNQEMQELNIPSALADGQAQQSSSDSEPCILDAHFPPFHGWYPSEALQAHSGDHYQAGSPSDTRGVFSVEGLSQDLDLAVDFTSWSLDHSGYMPFTQSSGSSQSETAASWLPGTSDPMDEPSSDSEIWMFDDSSPKMGSMVDMDNTLPLDPEGSYFIPSIAPLGPSQLGPVASALSSVPEPPASSSGGPLLGENSPFIRDIVRPCPKGDYCYLGTPALIACNSCLHKGMTTPSRPLIPLSCLPFRKEEDKSVRRHLTAAEILSILYLNTRYGMSFGMIEDLIKLPKSTICRQCNAPRIQEWLKSIPRCPIKNKRNSKIIKNVDDKNTARSS